MLQIATNFHPLGILHLVLLLLFLKSYLFFNGKSEYTERKGNTEEDLQSVSSFQSSFHSEFIPFGQS